MTQTTLDLNLCLPCEAYQNETIWPPVHDESWKDLVDHLNESGWKVHKFRQGPVLLRNASLADCFAGVGCFKYTWFVLKKLTCVSN